MTTRHHIILFFITALFSLQKANGQSRTAYTDSLILQSQQVRKTDADAALELARKALAEADRIGYKNGQVLALQAIGAAYNVNSSFELSRKYYTQALEVIGDQKKDTLRSRSLMGISTSLWHQGKYAEALEYGFQALRLAEQQEYNVFNIASAKLGIAMVYQTQEKLPLAEKYVQEALALLKEDNAPALLLNGLHTLANIYGMQGKIKEAFALDTAGIGIATRTNNDFAKSLFYDNMANCYLFGSPPDYTKASEYFRKALGIDSLFGNRKQMSDSYKNLGMVLVAQKQYAAALPYFFRSAELAQAAGFRQGAQETYKQLASTYQLLGKDKEALGMLEHSMRLKDSLINTASENRIAELQAYYETEKQKQTIALQQTAISRKNYLIIATSLALLLLLVTGYSVYRLYRRRQKAALQRTLLEQQELAMKAVMEAEEKERQRIARDLHDGIGQMMSAAKMNLSALESQLNIPEASQQASLTTVMNLVDDSCRELRHVSHNMMPHVLIKNNLALALGDFTGKLDKKDLTINLYTEGLEQRLDPATETVFYRVVQECVNNVLKHAHATRLDLSVIRDQESLSATIEDNGRGFDPGDPETAGGIGLSNIRSRIAYLKGTVDIDSNPGRGTLIAIHIPLTNQQQ